MDQEVPVEKAKAVSANAQNPEAPVETFIPASPSPTSGDNTPQNKNMSEAVMMWATVVMALATLVSAWAIFMQWREMVAGGADTSAIATAAGHEVDAANRFSDSANKINIQLGAAVGKLNDQAANMGKVADQALVQAKAANNLAVQAKRSANVSYKILTEDRAWIAVDNFQMFRFAADQPILANVELVNRGKTPAVDAEVKIAGALLDSRLSDEEANARTVQDLTKFPFQHLAALAPEGTHNLGLTDPSLYGQQSVNDFRAGHYIYYVFGRMEYDDVFGRPQWMTFCFRYRFNGTQLTMSYAEFGNDMSYEKPSGAF